MVATVVTGSNISNAPPSTTSTATSPTMVRYWVREMVTALVSPSMKANEDQLLGRFCTSSKDCERKLSMSRRATEVVRTARNRETLRWMSKDSTLLPISMTAAAMPSSAATDGKARPPSPTASMNCWKRAGSCAPVPAAVAVSPTAPISRTPMRSSAASPAWATIARRYFRRSAGSSNSRQDATSVRMLIGARSRCRQRSARRPRDGAGARVAPIGLGLADDLKSMEGAADGPGLKGLLFHLGRVLVVDGYVG